MVVTFVVHSKERECVVVTFIVHRKHRVCGCYFHSTQETQRECVVVTFVVHRKHRESVWLLLS